MKKLIIIILTLMSLVACEQSSQSRQQFTIDRSLPKEQAMITSVPLPAKEHFTASISVPKQIKSNEVFILEATLKNVSDRDLTILHASGVFYFSIKDSNGKGVNTFVMKEVGIQHPIQSKGIITERYEYRIDNPGICEVSAIAKFSLGEGDNFKEVETDKGNIEVVLVN
ncbi:putative periplasmic lipoprotein [Paenibacillus macquariensis]|uniref:Intracellular proteinase inhibitor BsuPI domain-containing protein n=1 Tax=Paenibacillus macquariensis TaxID=948756 RepID=A0ABY1JPQ1_9BACL|nr:hypothetical protein [Paenibacillus macquariensis]MEC0094044.1 hypothetical protein [Paenibacillus macquariensis]OAB37510.1 hypothetical protein PMSM_05465 [Paenibacillus macquariensis subsp. macquariensis]SIQ55093.1 hypothetical protein SAMN05421578_102526 [Paenibacillus macquariensis]